MDPRCNETLFARSQQQPEHDFWSLTAQAAAALGALAAYSLMKVFQKPCRRCTHACAQLRRCATCAAATDEQHSTVAKIALATIGESAFEAGLTSDDAPLSALPVSPHACPEAATDAASTQATAGGGPVVALDTVSRAIYESGSNAQRYLEFHFTPSVVSFCHSLKHIDEAFDFPLRVARKFQQYRPREPRRALDLGCALGAATFELSRFFEQEVIGVDLSENCIQCANDLKLGKLTEFNAPDQGETVVRRQICLPPDANADRCTFIVGDAQTVDPALGLFDGVLAANLLCRVPEPHVLLRSFAQRMTPGGILVLVSPYAWWEGSSARNAWVGGRTGEPRSEEQVKAILSEFSEFELLEEMNEPYLLRENERCFELGFSHCTVWRRN